MIPGTGRHPGLATYRGEIPCRRSGQRGFTVRVIPRNEKFPLNRFETGLIRWWDGNGTAAGAQATTATVVPARTPAG